MELELMHRWTASTYKALCAIPEDITWIQVHVPRMALKDEYLLHGMFALSALEIALCGGAVMEDDPAAYIQLALEYYDKASRSFRAQLERVTSENAQSMFMFSFLAVSINTALAQCKHVVSGDEPQSVRERMVALWELLIGNSTIARAHYEALISGAVLSKSTEALLQRTAELDESSISLTETQQVALLRLSAVAEKGGQSLDASHEARTDAGERLRAYRAGVAAVKTCMEWDSKDVMKGAEVAFPALAGQDFGTAFKRSDPVAMFIIMHWGALLHRLGKIAWWLGSFGSKMVEEISEGCLGGDGDLFLMPEWREGIVWARDEAELSPLQVSDGSIGSVNARLVYGNEG